MRTFAQESKVPQEAASAKATTPGPLHSGQSRELSSLLHWQRTLGNRAVQRMLRPNELEPELEPGASSKAPGPFAHDFSRTPTFSRPVPRLQPKLKVGPAADGYEQEAERISDEVMRMPEPRLQRACACGGECPECKAKRHGEEERLRTRRAPDGVADGAAAPPVVEEVLAEAGQPLDLADRGFMEPRFGHDFGSVRVHAGPRAGDAAESVGARAYTVGSHVVFGTGEYRPGTADGQRLLAHELAHVTQQNALAPLGGAVQRKDKPAPAPAPAKNTAAGGPQLDFRPAKNEPPCACIVFIHHNEPNARLMAQAMYELCRYNLAIVDPQTSAREINLPGKGTIDPNELFPRKVAEECWTDDKPCQEFLDQNRGATQGSVVEEYAQRQFFLAIKKCSKGFSLPVVALHNNTIDETADYRKAVGNTKAPLDLTPVKGKTFDDSLKAGAKSSDPSTLPFVELEDWLQKNVPGVSKRKAPKGKRTLEGGPITPGKTNIFLWCSAADISRCHIGDPERPDNVVWVTNSADFEKLRATKTNVVLQTRVDPGGLSATDLSSLFVFLQEIVGAHFAKIITDLESGIAVDAKTIQDAIDELGKLNEYHDLTLGNAWDQLKKILLAFLSLLVELLVLVLARGGKEVRLSQLRFINVETPQTAYDPATTKPADLRVQSYRDVRATLAAIGLDCCDAKPAEGQTESAVDKVEKVLKEGKLPKS